MVRSDSAPLHSTQFHEFLSTDVPIPTPSPHPLACLQAFGLSINVLKAQAGVQASGALKLDLSGVAKGAAAVGGAAMEVLSTVQFVVDKAFEVLGRVTGALDDLGDSASPAASPFGAGASTVSRILSAVQSVWAIASNARQV